MLERAAAVARDVIRVRVRLEHALDLDSVGFGGRQVLLDLERWVDDDGDTRVGVTDEVRGTAEVLIHELPKEQHGPSG